MNQAGESSAIHVPLVSGECRMLTNHPFFIVGATWLGLNVLVALALYYKPLPPRNW